MIINTLGPTGTDSHAAALDTVTSSQDKIVLYKSFDEIIEQLGQLSNQYILIPVAFESSSKDYDWKDLNFEYWEKLEIISIFSKKTKPMILIENPEYEVDLAIIQPATRIYMKKYLDSIAAQTEIIPEKSKIRAYEKFSEENYRYTICSKETVSENSFLIQNTFEPSMIWCLYRVKGEKNDSRLYA